MSPPTFDYQGSLRFARLLWESSDDAERLGQTRAASRDAALQQWRGPLGMQFAGRAQSNDAALVNATGAMRQQAAAWGLTWARAVNDMNDWLYTEAITVQEQYIARRQAEERAEIDYYDRMWAMNVDPDEPAVYSNPARDSARWIDVSLGAAANYVERPQTFDAVAPPSFAPPGGFLAQYYRAGDRLAISYIASIPGPPRG